MKISFPRPNNIEWLRTFFALQVVLTHTAEHMHYTIPDFIKYFPGVPAFFFVSGFLIYTSYLNAPGKRYFENRFLRIFPALVVVALGGLLLVVYAHGADEIVREYKIYIFWILSQITLGQAFNPGLFRDIGVGVINGSLWTITTELLFYIAIPFIVALERHNRHAVPMLMFISLAIYVAGPSIWVTHVYREKSIYDILSLTPIVWGWMFGSGIMAVKNYAKIQKYLRYFPLALLPILLMINAKVDILFGATGNRIGVLYFICYICLILWIAFYLKPVLLTIDLSYGMYIWHMPVINAMLVLGLQCFYPVLSLVFIISLFSWYCIEKPFLRRKKKSIAGMAS